METVQQFTIIQVLNILRTEILTMSNNQITSDLFTFPFFSFPILLLDNLYEKRIPYVTKSQITIYIMHIKYNLWTLPQNK